MILQPLRIDAYLTDPIALYDDYSPSIDGILETLWLKERNLFSTNPDRNSIVKTDLPVKKIEVGWDWYWAVSSPHYWYFFDDQLNYRKRWDPEWIGLIDWNGRKARWDGGKAEFKSFDLPLFLRNPQRITWYAVGDKKEILSLLSNCEGIGKKRNVGWGSVDRWEIKIVKNDYHLRGPKGQLMRPIPLSYLSLPQFAGITEYKILSYGWKPPARFNRAVCAVPSANVVMKDLLSLEEVAA